MDFLEGEGFVNKDDGPKRSYFKHENLPDVDVHVTRRDEHPLWSLFSKNPAVHGSTVQELRKALEAHPHKDIDYEND
jgi:hypothetical protein